jgi:Domain of unknown function (DUF4388)
MLKGTLDDFTLPDIFRLLSMAKRTGTLAVTRSAGSGRVFFRSGDVYFAESSLTREPLGQKLVRARAITEGQLMKALDEHASGGGRVGEILVASELVTLEQLESAVRDQIEGSVFDLLRWELGEFEWAPGVEAEVEVPIAVSVENLIMEASRRLDELEVIKRKIPTVDAVLRMAPKPPEGAVEINITPEEWRILVLVDGTRSVAAIAEAVALDEFGAMRVLYGLVSAGLIELSGETAPAAAPAEPEVDVAATAPFSLRVDLSPHTNGDAAAEPAAVEVDAAAEPAAVRHEDAPAFAPDDLSDEIPESLISELGGEPVDLDDISIETFDAPLPAELGVHEMDAADDTDEPAAVPEMDATDEPAAVQETDEPTTVHDPDPSQAVDAPAAVAPAAALTEAPLDRAAVVRELAGLFGDDDRPRPQRASVDAPVTPQRVEDDDQITKGLISRLIDGVKGL